MVQCSGGSWVVFLVHNALLVDTHTSFLSIPQVLMDGIHQLLLKPPMHLILDLQDSLATTRFKCPTMWGKNGLCSFQGHLVCPEDKCLSTFPVVCLTSDGVFSPPPPSLCHGPPVPGSEDASSALVLVPPPSCPIDYTASGKLHSDEAGNFFVHY